MQPHTTILGVETSCDDTSIAILRDGIVLANLITSQWIHKKYGGVVPEVASRLHVESILELYAMCLEQAQVKPEEISAVAVTRGPGLLGSLLVGLSFAKGIALSYNIPLIEVNHLHAHALSLFIEQKPVYPLLCLTVSGGHTQILKIESDFNIHLMGQTLDDAAGEAFDKTGKLFGLDYPCGPMMDQLAKSGKPNFKFPASKVPGYDFSFSGLKTAVLYFLRQQLSLNPSFIEEELPNLCASVQHAIVHMLESKLVQAAKELNVKSIGLAGGVSANSELRSTIMNACCLHGWELYLPALRYCTDNAAMIAHVGYAKYVRKEFSTLSLNAMARYPITQTQ